MLAVLVVGRGIVSQFVALTDSNPAGGYPSTVKG
jgi:hypothetical protein